MIFNSKNILDKSYYEFLMSKIKNWYQIPKEKKRALRLVFEEMKKRVVSILLKVLSSLFEK